MSDLLIAIDVSESRKNEFIVIKTYYTKKVSLSKTGKYTGGSINDADAVNCDLVDNVNQFVIRKLFNKFCYQVYLNAYYISADRIKDFFYSVRKQNIFFLDNPKLDLCLIRDISVSTPQTKVKYKYKVGSGTLYYHSNGVLSVDNMKTTDNTIKSMEPTPRLFFDKEKKIYSLFFDYDGEKVPYLDKALSVKNRTNILLRNFSFEKTIGQMIESKQFMKLATNHYRYSGHLNNQEINVALAQNGVMLEEDDNVIIPHVTLKKNGSGWFDIGLECRVGNEVIDLASKMDLFASKNEIQIGDKKVILPDSVIDAKKDFVFDGKTIKISRDHIIEVLHLIYDSGEKTSKFFSFDNIELKLPLSNLEKAYPYQIEGIKWLKFLFQNHFGGCLADDMGLGKTFQIISFFEDRDVKKNINKVLIVAPKSLLSNWKKEFEKFSFDYRVIIYHGDRRDQVDFENNNVIITTYNTAHLDLQKLNKKNFSLVVFDEIQMIKNYKSIISGSMKQLNVKARFGLSGTPMENNVSELWNIMDLINPGMFSTHASFMRRYDQKNYDELKNILNLFIMRRMKKNVLKELPPKSEEIIYCDMDQEQRKLYESINVAVRNEISSMGAFSAPIILKGLTLLRECCCDPRLLDKSINVDNIQDSCKMDALKILIGNLFQSGHKILLFSNYTRMLNIIVDELKQIEEYKNHIFYLDGNTKDRNSIVNQFENAAQGIFLISIKAGGVGLNLVSAQDVIIYDPWWNPFVEQQAIDRAYRIGQNNAVSVFRLVDANTIEEKIMDLQGQKIDNFEELIDGIEGHKNIDLNAVLKLL